MQALRAILAELLGLFVDDGWLAAALLGWSGAVGLAARLLPAPALLLAGGCCAILPLTVWRAARRRAGTARDR